MLYVDIAVFAYNEENNIVDLISDLARQSIIKHTGYRVRIHILCNGCTDRTVSVAKDALALRLILSKISVVEDYPEASKSLTWNRFVHGSHRNSSFTIFMDGDIRIYNGDALLGLIEELKESTAVAATSMPIKDASAIKNPLLRAAATMIKREHQDGPIAGSLYAVRTKNILNIYLPVPCLVEDGFLSACLVTGLFTHDGRPKLVKASLSCIHYFTPPSSLRRFFKHDLRLALGCELNAALYSDLWAAETISKRVELLRQFSKSTGVKRSISVHAHYPERSALSRRKIIQSISKIRNEEKRNVNIKFLFVVFHFIYMEFVRYRARRLFANQSFQW